MRFFQRILALALVAFCSSVQAQQKQFTNADLLAYKLPHNFYRNLPVLVKWLDDEHVVLYQQLDKDTVAKNYVLDIKAGRFTEVPMVSKTISGVEYPTTGTLNSIPKISPFGKSVIVRNKDLFYGNNGVETRLTNDKAEEKNPTFSPDSNYIAYTKNNNLYSYQLTNQKEIQLTTDGSTTTLNGYASWVYFEEIFGRPTRYRAFWWSPDSKQLAYMHFDEAGVPMFPIYVNEGQHGYIEETRYPLPGDKNPEVKIGLVSPSRGNTIWADFSEKEDQYFGWPSWKSGSNELMVYWMNRAQNNLKIFIVNKTDGSKKEWYSETQKTWIDLEDRVGGGRLNFLSDNKGVIIQSDKSGWNHLYLYSADGVFKNMITDGKFSVTNIVKIDEKNETIFYSARGLENTARTDLYSVKFNGSDSKRLTFGDYNHTRTLLSPNGKYFITTYSNASTPTRMALVDAKGKLIRELGDSKSSVMDEYAIAKTELIRIKSEDGLYDLPALVTWPTNMDPTKKYPLLVSIYGGPNAGTVMDGWSWSANRQFYANEGLIQVAFDHRASGHFGKEGLNYLYHNLGFWEMADYATMAKWFIANGHADSTKIAITGFSYGGYISAYALTYGADVFTHGMAGGSVVDWRLYDTHYTERYMGTPQNNPEGYKTSSVLTYADKYKGVLQIVHGTSDDNVHMQNSMQLVSALQDKGKSFELMLYPGGRHGWGGAKAVHFNNLKTKFIYKYLLEKEIPKGVLR